MSAARGAADQLLLMGHRGTGSCEQQKLHQDKCVNSKLPSKDTVRENTVRAMRVAHESGSHYVEFDVQLSKDGVPVIHHDFHVEDGRYVGDVPMQELQSLSNKASGSDIQQNLFPTLESFFTELPEELGFDIEIKYPRLKLDGTSLCPEFHWEMEDYIGRIVTAVQQFSKQSSRPLFYSCFVAEVCKLLKKLHPECPIVYLAGATNARDLTEIGGHSPENAFAIAAQYGLHGVAINSAMLLADRDAGCNFVQKCKQANIRCYTWGNDNNEELNRSLQRDWGVDGLIFDNIHCDKAPF